MIKIKLYRNYNFKKVKNRITMNKSNKIKQLINPKNNLKLKNQRILLELVKRRLINKIKLLIEFKRIEIKYFQKKLNKQKNQKRCRNLCKLSF